MIRVVKKDGSKEEFIVQQNREAAHDQQTCHRNTNSSKGHKAVEENTFNALFEQIT